MTITKYEVRRSNFEERAFNIDFSPCGRRPSVQLSPLTPNLPALQIIVKDSDGSHGLYDGYGAWHYTGVVTPLGLQRMLMAVDVEHSLLT